jgi:predicted nucleic acid-binding protein
MREVADRFAVVLDANVLFPFRVRDCLLRFAEAGLYRARWSPQILDEWARNLIEKRPHLESSIRSQLDAMARAFPEAMIEGYEELIPALNLPDENDRHVLAAAIRSGAQHIITENLRDFPKEAIDVYGIEAMSADQFLSSTYELYPSEATIALRKMRHSYQNPPMTPSEFLLDLLRVGLPLTGALARRNIDVL